MTDGGTAYLNLDEDYDVDHGVVLHNQRFVNSKRIEKYVDRLGLTVQVKVHTNTIEGHWGLMKPHFKVKRGIGAMLKNWCHFYSFKYTFKNDYR